MSRPETNPSKSLLVAYLGHLLVPLLIILDEVEFTLLEDVYRERPFVDKIVLSLCGAG